MKNKNVSRTCATRWFLGSIAALLLSSIILTFYPLYMKCSIYEFCLETACLRYSSYVCGIRTDQILIETPITVLISDEKDRQQFQEEGRWVRVLKTGWKFPHDMLGLSYHISFRYGGVLRDVNLLSDHWNRYELALSSKEEQAREFMNLLRHAQDDRDAHEFVMNILGGRY